MEDLTKQQLILLVLLITFVTSIGTGIITFTLLSEAPVEVTQTINRVVEKTIETVVTEPGQPERVVTTVVVNEEDRVIDAISKNERSIVRLKTTGADGSMVVSGLGLIVSADGVVVTDSRSYSSNLSYSIQMYDGTSLPVGKIYVDSQNGLVFMKISVPQTINPKPVFSPAIFGNSDNLKIGQTIVSIGGRESNSVTIGRIRQLSQSDDKKTITSINSDIVVGRATPGSSILNLSGEVVGYEAPVLEGETRFSYYPANNIKSSLLKAIEELAK
jgi:S1-C subfamily serine protease